MMRLRPIMWFVAMIIAGLLVVQVVGGGYYPIAMVNGSWIMQKDFRNARRGFITYYQQFINTYEDPKNADAARAQLASQGVEASTLTMLIEERLIHAALQTELGKDLQTTIKNRTEKYDADPELQNAAHTVSGLSFREFRALMLVPKAEEDILAGRLSLKGKTLDDWIREAKHAGEVKIFSRALYWDGVEVKNRE